jgi:hypothetical protein
MKQFFLTLSALLLHIACSGQQQPGQTVFAGNFETEKATSLNLEVHTSSSQTISFAGPADYVASKVVPAYFQLVVKAPAEPWVITATINSMNSGSGFTTNSGEFTSLVSLRNNMGQMVRLSQMPTIILQGGNNTSEQYYTIDLVIDPPFNMPAGNFLGMINFQLELQ